MNNWYLEFVTSIFRTDWDEDDDKEIDAQFPSLFSVVDCGYFSIVACVLLDPITAEQEALLVRLKSQEKILDWYARNQVHWAQLQQNVPVHPIAMTAIGNWREK